MRYLLLFTLFFLTSCSGALHMENDLFSQTKNSDANYTHGTKLSYFPENTSKDEHISYSLGQTIYTPEHKRASAAPESLKIDRPYAGWLFLERQKVEYVSQDIRDTWGLALGCVGECSQARRTQKQVHRFLDQYPPTWNNNYYLRHNEPGVILNLERAYLLVQSENFDVASYGGLKAGNLIDSGAVGLDVRIGYNLDKFSSEPIIFKLPKESPSPWMIYLFGKLEERAIAWNYFLDGSLFNNSEHTVTSKWNVEQADIGVSLGYDNFKFVYRLTFFSAEWKERNRPVSFGGLTLSW